MIQADRPGSTMRLTVVGSGLPARVDRVEIRLY
jgi:hypothetical protein